MDNSNTKKLVCRKCGGEHLTIKCGKEVKPSVIENKLAEVKPEESKEREYTKNKDNNTGKKEFVKKEFVKTEFKKFKNKHNEGSDEEQEERKPRERRPLHKVKMSNLPKDMTDDELLELLYEWGHVIRLRVLNYQDNSTAYIEFKSEEEADYLVKALDRTPFEYIMLDVSRLNE